MSGNRHRGGLGFGGAVGLGAAVALLITVIAIGRTLAGQLEGAMRVVIVFAEVAVCTLLGGVVLAVLGLFAYRGQLARLHLAERRISLEQLASGQTVRAEVLEGAAPALEGRERPALESGPRHLWAVRDSDTEPRP